VSYGEAIYISVAFPLSFVPSGHFFLLFRVDFRCPFYLFVLFSFFLIQGNLLFGEMKIMERIYSGILNSSQKFIVSVYG
jgi:hypothetical protein